MFLTFVLVLIVITSFGLSPGFKKEPISFITKNLKSSSNFSYVRLKKLFRSNSIKPNFLLDMKYPFKYDLSTSMEDWKKTNS